MVNLESLVTTMQRQQLLALVSRGRDSGLALLGGAWVEKKLPPTIGGS
jgi:hypothetical protein